MLYRHGISRLTEQRKWLSKKISTSLVAMFIALFDLKTNKTEHLKKWLSAKDWPVLKVVALNSAWRKK
jgi:hypothetical protein